MIRSENWLIWFIKTHQIHETWTIREDAVWSNFKHQLHWRPVSAANVSCLCRLFASDVRCCYYGEVTSASLRRVDTLSTRGECDENCVCVAVKIGHEYDDGSLQPGYTHLCFNLNLQHQIASCWCKYTNQIIYLSVYFSSVNKDSLNLSWRN